MDAHSDSDWSDSSMEAEATAAVPVYARAYQLEMFERSMESNIIVTMDTGSGKTQIAILRIEAELQRSPSKRVWFLCPSVVLAQQQHGYLSRQLPAYSIRVITGLDNAHFWQTQEVWDAVLQNRNVIVSTTQILLDALTHAFVSLTDVALLVFDEAHHCVGNAPMANIMKLFYHPLKQSIGHSHLPHILGLTASPVNSISALNELERNLDAVCKSPTRQIQEYRQFVHTPKLDRIVFSTCNKAPSSMVAILRNVVQTLEINDDPAVLWYKQQDSVHAMEKLNKIYRQGYTNVMKQMKSFLGNVEEIEAQIGVWAATLYVKTCVSTLNTAVHRQESVLGTLRLEELQYISQKLRPVEVIENNHTVDDQETCVDIAPKAQALINYLQKNYCDGISAIVFVNRRSVSFALTALLQVCKQLQGYRVFSFVGSTHPSSRNLTDLASMTLQNEAFADFRTGKQNLCVATSVMEEGVDVQAISLVIRFDLPPTLRAFVQSRGRARQPSSKLVLVFPEEDQLLKFQDWEVLERILKAQYSDAARTLIENDSVEQEDSFEDYEDIYRVAKTGAVLSIDNARQHLEHFVSTLVHDEPSEPKNVLYIISGEVGESITAQIRLPASIAPALQITNSLRTWRSEKAAVKDAAFQCYRRLHMAGVVNDNLLPFRLPKNDPLPQTRDSTYNVLNEVHPWSSKISADAPLSQLHCHSLEVQNDTQAFPKMMLLMPTRLDHVLAFQLYSTPFGELNVQISPSVHSPDMSTSLAYEVSVYLFNLILGRRLKTLDLSLSLPYLLLPYLSSQELTSWINKTLAKPTPLVDMMFNRSLENQRYLVKYSKQEVLYHWSPSFEQYDVKTYKPNDTITAQRLTKQLNFLTDKLETQSEDERQLIVENCTVQPVSATYGELMLLVPSITYVVELALRSQMAVHDGPLRPIGFKSTLLVRKALTASAISADANYECLEFLGDSLLKHYASLHVFFEYPLLPESALSAKRQRLISNARLQKSTRELGLDAYITTKSFASQDWTLDNTSRSSNGRNMSSKTLADIIEALLGAAFLDEANLQADQDLVIKALQNFLPEASWQSPESRVESFQKTIVRRPLNLVKLTEVESMLAYNFNFKGLLAEALTRNALTTGTPSYERLEFLGDAILDHIVGITLYQSNIGSAERMTTIHHALVNHHFLAFLGMNISRTTSAQEVNTTQTGNTTFAVSSRVIRLVDYVTTISDKTQIEQRQRAEETYTTNRDAIFKLLTEGKTFPWTTLQSLDTSKMYSDIIESILAAIFIDSSGSIAACQQFLERLGLMQVLRQLASDSSIEVRPPLVLLRLRHPSVVVERKARGQISKATKRWKCMISLDDKLLVRKRSYISQSHAESVAAEAALLALEMK